MQLKVRQKSKLSDDTKSSFAGIILVANTFVWFLYCCRLLSKTIDINGIGAFQSTLWSITILGTVGASVFGFYLSNNPIIKKSFIKYWLLAGIPLSLLLSAMDFTVFPNIMIFFSLAGVYFGLGMPISLACFASATNETNRSRLGGLTFLTIFVSVTFLAGLGITDPVPTGIILALIKVMGLVAILKIHVSEKSAIKKEEEISYRQIFRNRTFILYFLPWIMFSVANYIAVPIVGKICPNVPNLLENSSIIENILVGGFAVVSGFIADHVGRRRLVLAGFVLLGFGYASLGLLQGTLLSTAGWWFYTIVDGVAWGIFYTMFLLTLWGDISLGKNSEKYYAIGYLPFLFSIFTEISIGTAISGIVLPTAIFSFISLFLFVAVVPLAYAPETLPHQVMKNRELQNYIEKAQRVANDSV
jgi:hypothetical protein